MWLWRLFALNTFRPRLLSGILLSGEGEGGWWVSGLNVVPKHDHSSPHCFASWWWQHVVVRGEVTLVSAPSLAEPTDTDLYLEDLHMPHGSLKLISHYEEENGRTTLINIQLFTMFPMMCLWDFSSEVTVGAVLVFTFSFCSSFFKYIFYVCLCIYFDHYIQNLQHWSFLLRPYSLVDFFKMILSIFFAGGW